jgi:DNA-directed RNA polymerase specialized sigma24 family protein
MAVTALPDAELLDQARNGDEAAFTELYVRHQPAALRLASTYRRLGDPEDLVNEAFEKGSGRRAARRRAHRGVPRLPLRDPATPGGRAG